MSDSTQLSWVCTTCSFPIADGTGVLGIPFVDLAAWPEVKPNWRAIHDACLDPERDVYGISVAEIRDAHGLLRWTVHLMSKRWFGDSNWRGVLAVAVQQREVPA